jgi:hypothetical protein
MTLPIRCELLGHKPKDIDPTGGDPWMGGPVAITVCDRCGRELPHSATAKAFNDRIAALARATPEAGECPTCGGVHRHGGDCHGEGKSAPADPGADTPGGTA